MSIILRTTMAGPDGTRLAGSDVSDLPPQVIEDLVRGGYAVRTVPEKAVTQAKGAHPAPPTEADAAAKAEADAAAKAEADAAAKAEADAAAKAEAEADAAAKAAKGGKGK